MFRECVLRWFTNNIDFYVTWFVIYNFTLGTQWPSFRDQYIVMKTVNQKELRCRRTRGKSICILSVRGYRRRGDGVRGGAELCKHSGNATTIERFPNMFFMSWVLWWQREENILILLQWKYLNCKYLIFFYHWSMSDPTMFTLFIWRTSDPVPKYNARRSILSCSEIKWKLLKRNSAPENSYMNGK